MSEWISVKERLPEDGQRVLAWNGHQVWLGKRRKQEPRQRGGLWVFNGSYYGEEFITHWQPLPDPPAWPPKQKDAK